MKSVIIVKTFKKIDACRVLIDSLVKHDYFKGENILVITDDFNAQPVNNLGSTRELFYDDLDSVIDNKYLAYGDRMGIWGNFNRGLRVVYEKIVDYDNVLILDDDIEFIAPGLLEEMALRCQTNNINHLTLLWPESVKDAATSISGGNWYLDFPAESMGDRVTWHGGCHGVGLFFTKKALDAIGYMQKWPGGYGYEHSEFSARAILAGDSRSPFLFPIYTRSHKYIKCQNIANRYNDSAEGITKNAPLYDKCKEEIWKRNNLRVKDHSLNLKTEKIEQ